MMKNGQKILPYLGEHLILTIVRENRKSGKARKVMERLILTVPYEADPAFISSLLTKWYRKEAGAVLKEKVQEFAELIGVSYEQIHIKDQRSCWGSCSSKGNLNFNWRIIMAPEPVCDYIIIHELCHRIYMNHSRDFWNLVEKYCPQHESYKKWLKENYRILYPF